MVQGTGIWQATEGGLKLHLYTEIYEFAASAGAFEGYVYRREDLDQKALSNWVGNLVGAYGHLPAEVRREIQRSVDQTIGRAVRSIAGVLGEGHALVVQLGSLVRGPLPQSADDFQKRKGFQENP